MLEILFKIIKNKIILSIVLITTIMLVSLSIYLPQVTEQNIISLVTDKSKTRVEQMKLTREYYVKEVTGDIKKYAPNIKFDYDHFGVDGKIAFPTSLIHDLSDIYSKNTDVIIRLYSDYPFKPKANRVLEPVQKEALNYVENDEEGVWVKRDTVNEKEVLRVAVADFMTQQACISCHNSHKDKTWDFDWEIGDKRGVIEIITPLDKSLHANNVMKNKILILIFISMLILVVFYSISLLRREKELGDINKNLENIVDDQNIQLKKNIELIGKYIIYSRTDLKGVITDVSDAFCEISQYSRDELIGKTHNIIRHPDMLSSTFEDMWSKIKNGKTWYGEIKNLKKDGNYYWVGSTIAPELDRNNEVIGYLAIRQDITSAKDLDISSKKLFEAEKLASLGEMIGNIAHQWRQPLSAVTSCASSVKLYSELGTIDHQEITTNMDKIIDKAEYLSNTISTFRNFLKQDKSLKEFEANDLIHQVSQVVETTLKDYQIKLIDNISADENTYIYGIEDELSQVIINIIYNAKDILLERDIKDPWIKLDLEQHQNKTILTIEDNGQGIPNDVLPKIFEPYFTTKHQSQGTGLGLHMSYQIITESFKGKLYAKNSDHGAKFFIELPLCDLSNKPLG